MYCRCEYCGELFGISEEQITYKIEHDCVNSTEPLKCYSCGATENPFSNSQWTSDKPRCKICIEKGQRERFAPFRHLSFTPCKLNWYYGYPKYEDELFDDYLNDQSIPLSWRFEWALQKFEDNQVKKLLIEGANPNENFCSSTYDGHAVFDKYGNCIPLNEKIGCVLLQPINPIRWCIFRKRDCSLTKSKIQSLLNIFMLLINYGAKWDHQYYNFCFGEEEEEEAETSPTQF